MFGAAPPLAFIVGYQSSAPQAQDSARLPGEVRIMGHQHKRRAGCGIEFKNQPHDLLRGLRIKVTRGLVGEKNLWPVHERAGDRNPLLFSAGKLNRVVVQAVFETDPLQQICGTAARVIFTADLRGHHHVFQSGQRRQQLEALEDETDKLVADLRQLLFVRPVQRDSIEDHRSFAGTFKTGADSDQRRLPAARRADNRAGASGLDGKGHIAKDGKGLFSALKKLPQMLYA
jgi:hypothetical protein